MKTKKLVLIIILSVIALFVILNISGTLKYSFYNSEVSTSISSTWNNSKSISKYNGSNEEIPFPTVPIIVVYDSKQVGDTTSQDAIKIDISDKNFGLLWVPLIKKSDYHFSLICKDVREIKSDSVIGQFIINGEINVSGHYKFIGSYSITAATNIIVDKLLNDIFNEIKKNIK